MSRHKNYRGMNLDAELDDFDGEDYYEEAGDDTGMFELKDYHSIY